MSAPFLEDVTLQAKVLKNISWSLTRLVVDPTMHSRISFKTFVGDFVGMLMHEGVTNRHITCEQVAEEALGKGNHDALKGRVAIITGASSGLGAEHARVLMKYGCHVIFAVRSPVKAEVVLSRLQAAETLSGQATILPVDLDDLSTIRPFVEKFRALGLPLHYLVNNAGVMTPKEFKASKQGYETQFATNHLAHFLLTELLLPKLRESRARGEEARIVILSSVGSTLVRPVDIDKVIPPRQEDYNGMAEYGISKALNLLHCRDLQQRCAEDGVVVCAVHPGVIKTGLTREGNADSASLYESILFRWMHKDVPEGAATQMYCTVCPDVPKQIAQDSTCFWFNSAPQRAVGIAAPGVQDDAVAKVREISERLVAPFMCA